MSEKRPKIDDDICDEDEPYPSDDPDELLMPGEFDHHVNDRRNDEEEYTTSACTDRRRNRLKAEENTQTSRTPGVR